MKKSSLALLLFLVFLFVFLLIPLVHAEQDEVQEWIDALKDEDPRIRQTAAEILGRLKDPRAIGPLIAVLVDASPKVREAAIEALQAFPGWEESDAARSMVPELIEALKDEDPEVRRAAGEALGKIIRPPLSALSWSRKASMPTPRGWAPAVVEGDKIYVVGGCSSSVSKQFHNMVSTLEVYDPETDIWQKLTPMSVPRVGPAVAAFDGKIYVFGGFNRDTWSANDSVEIYDIAKDKWYRGAPMPTPRSWARAVVLNGKIYVIGGVGYGYRRDVEAYDPATNAWEKKSPLLPRERYLHAAVAYNGKIYVIGGDSWENGYQEIWDDVQEYDPVTDKWTRKAPMPAPATSLDAVVVDGRIYVFGNLSERDRCWVYDIGLDRWYKISSTHTHPVDGSESFVFWRGYIFRFGGGWWGPSLDIVESARLSTPTERTEP